MRDYYDNRWAKVEFGRDDRISTPTGYGVFTRHFVDEGEPPREWSARLYNIQRWTPMPRGGHFAAVEEPESVAHDTAAFFGTLEQADGRPPVRCPTPSGGSTEPAGRASAAR